MEQTNNLSPKTIWGKVIIDFREKNNIMMHLVCGDITNVSVENNVFIIRSDQQNVIEMLNQSDNNKELSIELNKYGIKEYKIIQDEKTKTDEENILILKKYFNGEITIVNKGE